MLKLAAKRVSAVAGEWQMIDIILVVQGLRRSGQLHLRSDESGPCFRCTLEDDSASLFTVHISMLCRRIYLLSDRSRFSEIWPVVFLTKLHPQRSSNSQSCLWCYLRVHIMTTMSTTRLLLCNIVRLSKPSMIKRDSALRDKLAKQYTCAAFKGFIACANSHHPTGLCHIK